MHASYCYCLRGAKVDLGWYSFLLSLAAIILLDADKVSSLVITSMDKQKESKHIE